MGRKRVELTLVRNNTARKLSLKKRRGGMLKKLAEISTLCGVEACAVVYSPDDALPTVWPSPTGIAGVVSRFKELPPTLQTSKMFDHQGYLRQRINKAREQLRKQRIQNQMMENQINMFKVLNGQSMEHLDMESMNEIKFLLDQRSKEIQARRTALINSQDLAGGPPPPPASTLPPLPPSLQLYLPLPPLLPHQPQLFPSFPQPQSPMQMYLSLPSLALPSPPPQQAYGHALSAPPPPVASEPVVNGGEWNPNELLIDPWITDYFSGSIANDSYASQDNLPTFCFNQYP